MIFQVNDKVTYKLTDNITIYGTITKIDDSEITILWIDYGISVYNINHLEHLSLDLEYKRDHKIDDLFNDEI